MVAFITHDSARAFWSAAESLDSVSTRSRATCIAEALATHQELKGLGIPRSAIVDKKLHLLVRNQKERRCSRFISAHSCTNELPPGSFRKISPSLFVASPELMFIQMACRLSFVETIRLGCELCGTYIPTPANSSSRDRKPLTSKEKIDAFITSMRGRYGVKKAAKALKYVVEYSNSPMETTLELLLCLPNCYGGYGLPVPSMNHPITLTRSEAHELGRSVFLCDLFWPEAGYALEYYGREWHADAQSVAHDALRQSDLHYCGIDIDVVTYEQLQTASQVQILATKVAKRLSIRLRKPSDRWIVLRNRLHRELIGWRSSDSLQNTYTELTSC